MPREETSFVSYETRGDSCGCAMGARFTGVALIVLGAWYAYQWYFGMISVGGAVVRVLVGAFVAGGIGKLFGILRFRARARNSFTSKSADRHTERHGRDPVSHHEEL